MLKIGHVRFRGKCSKHPNYDPHDGVGAIKGGCQKCEQLWCIMKQHALLIDQMKSFTPPKEFKKFRAGDDRQMGLFTEESVA